MYALTPLPEAVKGTHSPKSDYQQRTKRGVHEKLGAFRFLFYSLQSPMHGTLMRVSGLQGAKTDSI